MRNMNKWEHSVWDYTYRHRKKYKDRDQSRFDFEKNRNLCFEYLLISTLERMLLV